MKRGFSIFIFLLIVILSFCFVYSADDVSQEEKPSLVDCGGEFGLKDFNCADTNCGKSGENGKMIWCSFDGENPQVCFGKDNCFENIESQSVTKSPSYIEMDSEGNVLRADFKTNEKGGEYNLCGQNFKVEPYSKVHCDMRDVKNSVLQLPDNAEILDKNSNGSMLIIKGTNIILPSGDIVSGKFNRLGDDEYFFYSGRNHFDGVELNSVTGGFLFTDGSECDYSHQFNTCITIDSQNKIIRGNLIKGTSLSFEEGNSFIKSFPLGEGQVKLISDSEDPGYKFSIINRDSKGLPPLVDLTGRGSFQNGVHVLKVSDNFNILLEKRNDFGGSPISAYPGDDNPEDYPEIHSSPMQVNLTGCIIPTCDSMNLVFDDQKRLAVVDTFSDSADFDDSVSSFTSPPIKSNVLSVERIEAEIGRKILLPSELKKDETENYLYGLKIAYNKLTDFSKTDVPQVVGDTSTIYTSSDYYDPEYPNSFNEPQFRADVSKHRVLTTLGNSRSNKFRSNWVQSISSDESDSSKLGPLSPGYHFDDYSSFDLVSLTPGNLENVPPFLDVIGEDVSETVSAIIKNPDKVPELIRNSSPSNRAKILSRLDLLLNDFYISSDEYHRATKGVKTSNWWQH